MGDRSKVLVVDRDAGRREELVGTLEAHGFDATGAAPVPASNALGGTDLVLAALDPDTLTLVERWRQLDPLVPVVVHAARQPDSATAAALGRARVYDVLVVRAAAELGEHVPRLQDAAARQAIRRRQVSVAEDLLGESPKLSQVRRYIAKAAQSDANVVITGESGTGKELVARAIHAHGSRSSGAFVAVNCSAIPDALLESELFGHEKGSFTGAVARQRGHFEQADGGTLFFDEVADMPLPLQAKLLRVLQPPPGTPETTREFTRVGAEQPTRANVRLIFATQRDLLADVRSGRFRDDLYQRIHVLLVRQPPLRDRKQDIPLLAVHFLQRYGQVEGRGPLRFDPLVLDILAAYDYPLNVRELEGIVRSLVVMKDAGNTVVLGDLPPHLFGRAAAPMPAAHVENDAPAEPDTAGADRLLTLAEVERAHVRRVLDHAHGNKSQAARILGISRPALDRRLAADKDALAG